MPEENMSNVALTLTHALARTLTRTHNLNIHLSP